MVDPVLLSAATTAATTLAKTLSSKAAGGIYELVTNAFRRHDATATLEAAHGAEPDSPPVQALATRIAEIAEAEPEFAAQLRTWVEHHSANTADHDGVVNQISGNVTGKVVQARDIHGDIRF